VGVAVLACLHHLERPSLGLAEEPLLRAGLTLDERDLRAGDPLPEPGSFDGLLTLGGEQSLREVDRYPYLGRELDLLSDAVEGGVPTLGICLGGQLLAHAGGAAIEQLPRRVIGWPEVRRTEAASGDPLFAGVPDAIAALHWNEDFFRVPDGAVELLSRSDLGGEAFRLGARAWGLQFHPEAEESILDTWYARPEVLVQAAVTERQGRAADEVRMPGQRLLAESLFGTFAGLVASS
jgi:GMP synthase-like glutamine amidotransferase